MLLYENVSMQIFPIMRVFEGVYVNIAKSSFLHSLDVPIKMFANRIAVLNHRIPGKTDHVHHFQTVEIRYLVVSFWVAKRPVCCFFLYKNSLDTQTSFSVDGEWNRP